MVRSWTIKHVSLNLSTIPQTNWNISILPYLGYHPMWSCHRLSYQAQGIVISIEICLHLLQKKTRDRGWFVSRRLMKITFKNNSCPSKGRMTDLWWVAQNFPKNRSTVKNMSIRLPSMCPFHCLGFYWPFVRIDKTRYEFVFIKFFASTPLQSIIFSNETSN